MCKACRGGEGQNKTAKKGATEGRRPWPRLRPEEKTDTSDYDTRVRQKVGRGGAVMTGLAPGPNTKGRVGEEIKNQWQEVRGDAADPMADQQLPAVTATMPRRISMTCVKGEGAAGSRRRVVGSRQ